MPTTRTHGTRARYSADKCRCQPCRHANTTYEQNRTRQRAYGRTAYVNAQPAREHIKSLQAAGMGWKRIAHRAELNTSVVYALIYGTNGTPSKRIRPATQAAILNVPTPTVHDLGRTVNVNATGARRRLEALMCMGWSIHRLAQEHGVSRQALDRALTQTQVQAQTAVTVQSMYASKSMQTATATTPIGQAGISRTRNRAKAAGWVPPLGWDDDQLDDPTAIPGDTERDAFGFDFDEYLRLLHLGEYPERAAARSGVTQGSVDYRARRIGRLPELRAALEMAGATRWTS